MGTVVSNFIAGLMHGIESFPAVPYAPVNNFLHKHKLDTPLDQVIYSMGGVRLAYLVHNRLTEAYWEKKSKETQDFSNPENCLSEEDLLNLEFSTYNSCISEYNATKLYLTRSSLLGFRNKFIKFLAIILRHSDISNDFFNKCPDTGVTKTKYINTKTDLENALKDVEALLKRSKLTDVVSDSQSRVSQYFLPQPVLNAAQPNSSGKLKSSSASLHRDVVKTVPASVLLYKVPPHNADNNALAVFGTGALVFAAGAAAFTPLTFGISDIPAGLAAAVGVTALSVDNLVKRKSLPKERS